MSASQNRRSVNLRLHQCPGCWSYGSYDLAAADYYECECGERLDDVDLRDAWDPNEQASFNIPRKPIARLVGGHWEPTEHATADDLKLLGLGETEA